MFGNKKVAVVIPCGWRQVDTLFYDAMLSMAVYSVLNRKNTEIHFLRVPDHLITVARNQGVWRALKAGADFICQIDADMTPPPDLLERFAKAMKKEPSIDALSAACTDKIYPYTPSYFNIQDKGDGTGTVRTVSPDAGLVEIDFFGSAAFIARRELYETVPAPWFADVYNKEGTARTCPEDVYFCQKALRHGMKLFVDTSIRVGHVHHVARGLDDWIEAGAPMEYMDVVIQEGKSWDSWKQRRKKKRLKKKER